MKIIKPDGIIGLPVLPIQDMLSDFRESKKPKTANLEDVKQNLRNFRYQNNEVPHVRKWIHEQELKPSVQYPTTKKTKNKTKTTHDWYEKPLDKIAIIVVGGFLVLVLAWVANHYWGLEL